MPVLIFLTFQLILTKVLHSSHIWSLVIQSGARFGFPLLHLSTIIDLSMGKLKDRHRGKLRKKNCHCTPECGRLLVYCSRLCHYKVLSSAECLLRRGSESPTEDASYVDLGTDIEMEPGAGVESDDEEMESASASSDESEESFPDDDAWNQYNEDEELDAEVRFRQFEELLEAGSDIGDDERKLQYTKTSAIY
jgi:hypothetical protein